MLARAGTGDPDAELALDVYVHRLRAGIATMVAALEGLDVLAFTGGVGERSAEIRARTIAGFGFLGVHVDQDANRTADGDHEITARESPVRTLVLQAREDLEIARQARQALAR